MEDLEKQDPYRIEMMRTLGKTTSEARFLITETRM